MYKLQQMKPSSGLFTTSGQQTVLTYTKCNNTQVMMYYTHMYLVSHKQSVKLEPANSPRELYLLAYCLGDKIKRGVNKTELRGSEGE